MRRGFTRKRCRRRRRRWRRRLADRAPDTPTGLSVSPTAGLAAGLRRGPSFSGRAAGPTAEITELEKPQKCLRFTARLSIGSCRSPGPQPQGNLFALTRQKNGARSIVGLLCGPAPGRAHCRLGGRALGRPAHSEQGTEEVRTRASLSYLSLSRRFE